MAEKQDSDACRSGPGARHLWNRDPSSPDSETSTGRSRVNGLRGPVAGRYVGECATLCVTMTECS